MRLRTVALTGLLLFAARVDASTITVNSTVQVISPTGNGDGLCSLGEAIRAANSDAALDGCAAGSAGDTISLPAGVFTFTAVDSLGTSESPFALPPITSDIAIVGAGATTVLQRSTALGTPQFAFFDIQTGNLFLSQMTIADGSQEQHGGAVFNNCGSDCFSVIDVWFLRNRSTNGNGGAVAGGGHFEEALFTENVAALNGGAIEGASTAIDTAFEDNDAAGNGGAISCTVAPCTISVTQCTFSGNSAGNIGGAIGTPTVLADRSWFTSNSANAGGAIYLFGSGGSITDSLFDNNSASLGGAVATGDTVSPTISGSLFKSNTATEFSGGALWFGNNSSVVNNSTFIFNSATDAGGAILSGGAQVFSNLTIVSNSALNHGGGIALNSGTAVVRNSLIANNSSGSGGDCSSGGGGGNSQGYNLIGIADGACSWTPATGDLLGSTAAPLDPLLDSLADNGGRLAGASNDIFIRQVVQTLAPTAASPAIDAGNPALPGSGGTACESTDQRGAARPSGVACDIGAFEGIPSPYLSPTPYLSVEDSPFVDDILAGNMFNEDFEDGLLNTPGVVASTGSSTLPGGLTDSVDGDDGVLDGNGTNGRSWFSGSGATGITFFFDPEVLGGYPVQAGIAWTDGQGTTSFEAFNQDGVSLGVLGPFSLDDGNLTGNTAEDRFFAVSFQNGISAIKISNTTGGIEVDHLQYGFNSVGEADVSVSFLPPPAGTANALTYTFVVSNAGPDLAVDITFQAQLTGVGAFQSASLGCNVTSRSVGCALGNLGVGAQRNVTVTVQLGSQGWSLQTVSVSSANEDPLRPNNSASVRVGINHAPTANAGTARVLPATGVGTRLILDGTGSRDPDGDSISYRWSGPFAEGGGIVSGVTPVVTLPPGVHAITLVTTDALGLSSAPAEVQVVISDFELKLSPPSTTMLRGGTAQFLLTVMPRHGAYDSPVALHCSGLPADLECRISQASTLPGTAGSELQITVQSKTHASARPSFPGLAAWMFSMPLLLMMSMNRRRSLLVFATLALLLLISNPGCGGAPQTTPPVSNAITSSFSVSGSSQSLEHTVAGSVTVR